MEIIEDRALVCSVVLHGKTSQIVHLFSKEHGMMTAYFKGALLSNRKRNLCVTGNLVDFQWKARISTQMGMLEVFRVENFSTSMGFFQMALINTVCEILMLLLKMHDVHAELFDNIINFFCFLKEKSADKLTMLVKYVMFEIDLMSLLGFGFNFNECNISGEKPVFISPKTGNTVSEFVANGYEDRLFRIPFFLKDRSTTPSMQDIQKALDINLHFLKLHFSIKEFPMRNFMLSII